MHLVELLAESGHKFERHSDNVVIIEYIDSQVRYVDFIRSLTSGTTQ